MEKLTQMLSKVLIVILVSVIPFVSFSQPTPASQATQSKKEEPKGKKDGAPSYSYWYVTAFGGISQFNGDLAKNPWINLGPNLIGYDFGLLVGKQFSRVIGVRARIAVGKLQSRVEGKYNAEGYIWKKFIAFPVETDLNVTINWLNWILGYNPERLFSSYLIVGAGADHTSGHRTDLLTTLDDSWLGTKGKTNVIGSNTSGIGGLNLEFKAMAGLGFDFNINKHWSINPEILWRWRDGDVLDMTKGGVKEVKFDMYSSANIGLTYKFGYSGGNIKEMEKKYSLVKYEVIPPVLSEKCDSVTFIIKGTFPPKYFGQRVGMYFQPEMQYQGGSMALKPMNIMGEKVTGDGTMIKYKEGGTFTYTTVFPYKPELNTSELVVAPIIYEAKDKKIMKKEDIKNAKNIQLPSRDLAPGVIYTPTRIIPDMAPLIADHGYQKEVMQSKTGILYFKINLYKLDLKFGLNKTPAAKEQRDALDAFIQQGWKIKDLNINGWASPDGQETFNIVLSENRSKTGNSYMIDQFKSWVKEKEKGNKDKKAVKAMVEAAGKDVNFVIDHHGPDWNGFIKEIQVSSLKDKDKILNVINSAGDNKKKEQEVHNMILIYPELEENLLPPLRRDEITVNLYEPKKTDEEISKLAISNPDLLKVEEILYAGTLTTDNDTKVTIYDNAARVYPENWKALNNAAYANIIKGNNDKAGNYLQKAATLAPNTGIIENNIGVIAAKNGDYKKAEAQFTKAQQLGENENYNLGVFQILKCDYQKAMTMMANAKCSYNLGLAQLVSGNTSGAISTLGCAPPTPQTYYLLAICGARSNNTKMLYDNLVKAVADPKLKEQAKGDREFYNYMNLQDFKNIVK